MKTYYVVAHNYNGYAYIREVLESSTTVYADCELGGFVTLAEAEKLVAKITPELEAEWEAQWQAQFDNED